MASGKAPSNELVTFLILCGHEQLRSCCNSSHEVFFSPGKGTGIALVRVGMGKPIGHNTSCFLWWFLHGTYSNVTCDSCSFLCNFPTCGGVAGPCQLCSGIEAELGRLQKKSDLWLLKDRLQVIVSDSVTWLRKVRNSRHRGSLLKSLRTLGVPQMCIHSQLLPLRAINGEHTLNYSWSGSNPLASETLGSSLGLLLQRINLS